MEFASDLSKCFSHSGAAACWHIGCPPLVTAVKYTAHFRRAVVSLFFFAELVRGLQGRQLFTVCLCSLSAPEISWAGCSGLLLHTTQQRSISASWTRRLRQGHEGQEVPSVGFWSKISIYIDYRLAMVTYTAGLTEQRVESERHGRAAGCQIGMAGGIYSGMRERCNVLQCDTDARWWKWDWQACRRTRTGNGRLLLVEKGLFLGLRRHPLCGWRMQLTTFTPYGIHWIIQSFELH